MAELNTLRSSRKEIAPGDVILDKYRFERFLGEGGQACVWQGQNLLLDLPVAIKIVHPDSRDRSLPERLFREARAAAMLGHPAIVRVLDLGQAPDGAPFLVMELLKGESLADRLVQVGRLAPERALRVLLPIADALVAAHSHGVVHRDVKPDNVFLAISGAALQPKLLDFGIARLTQGSLNPRALTKSGVILGTPAYLSPEQAEGLGTVDFRSDIWSFCAMAYECLSGEVPFAASKWIDLRRRILEDEPKPLTEFGIEDTKLWQILRRGLEKAPENRWPSMLELGRALARWLIERGVTEDICGTGLSARWLRRESLVIELLTPPSQVQEAPRPGVTASPHRSGAEVRSNKTVRERAFPPMTIVGLTATAAAWILTVLFMVLGTRQADPVPAAATQRAIRSQNGALVQFPKGQERVRVDVGQPKPTIAPAAPVVFVQPVDVVGTPPVPAKPQRAVPQQVAAGAPWSQGQAADGATRELEPSARAAATRPGSHPDTRVRPTASSIVGLEPLDPY